MMLKWAVHRHAWYYLAGVSLSEASFFPIPPDIMLAPMVLAKRQLWWQLACFTTLFSVVGGLLGYCIGFFSFEIIGISIISNLGLEESYAKTVSLFEQWGVGMILVAGFTPIPYKLFTIAAGAAKMPVIPFMLASMAGRFGRFILVAGCVKWLGPAFEMHILKKLDMIGWVLLALILVAIWLLKFW